MQISTATALPSLSAKLTAAEVATHCKVHVKTIFRWLGKKQFPEPIKLGERCLRWDPASVQKFLAEREGSHVA